MEITNVGEAAIPAAGGVKAPGDQAGSGGFDMAMAAVLALLMPNSGDSPPAQNVSAGGAIYPEDAAFTPSENINSQTAGLARQQGYLSGVAVFDALDAGTKGQAVNVDDAQQPPQTVQISLLPGNNVEPENYEVRQDPVMTGSSIKGPESTEPAVRPPLFYGAAENGAGQEKAETVPAGQNTNINAEEDTLRAAPGLISSQDKTTPDKAATAQVNIAAETAVGRSTGETARAEGKSNVVLAGAIEAGGTGSAGEARNESGGFNNSPGDASQPDPAQINAAGNMPGTAKNLKSVSLPELKDVVLQEIKHNFEYRKGEPTQIQLQLEPENLGKLTIRLSYSNGELNAHFYTGSEHVKEILEGSIGQLRENLGRQELTLNQALVLVADENNNQGAGGHAGFGNRRAEFFADSHSGSNYPHSDMEPDDYYRTDTVFSGVNYLV